MTASAIARPPSSAGASGTSVSTPINQTAHGFVVGNVLRFNGTIYVKAQANSSDNAEVVGIVSAVAGVDDFTITTSGKITGLSGLTAGTVYFLSDATAGLLTATSPVLVGSVSKPLLIAYSTTAGYFVDWRGELLTMNGGGAPGLKLDYAQFIAPVAITATTEGTANTIVTGNAVVYDGVTQVKVEFYAPNWDLNSTTVLLALVLEEDGIAIGQSNKVTAWSSTKIMQEVVFSRVFTPTAGSHTYSVRAFLDSAATGHVNAGAGGAGNLLQGYLSITTVTPIAMPTAIGLDGWNNCAGETWTYASADSPTFTFTTPGDLSGKYFPGQRIKLTQTTVKYFIVTAVAYSAGTTTVTVYGGTDYTLANAAISSPYFSTAKAPGGFPLSPAKWTVTVTDSSTRTQSSPTANTWYNGGSVSISLPIGVWDVTYKVTMYMQDAQTGSSGLFTTLSTANNTESDTEMSCQLGLTAGTGLSGLRALFGPAMVRKLISVASKTSYFLNYMTSTTSVGAIGVLNGNSPCVIKAVCAYL